MVTRSTVGAPMRARTAAGAAALVAALLAVTSCGGSTSDKAGGRHPTAPTVLTMANQGFSSRELEPFAQEVAKRSGGTLGIRFANTWRAGQRDSELGIIRDVEDGKVQMGWVGGRAFDAVGVTAFDALQAPFAIDSYALEQAVVESEIPDRMLEGLKPLGVAGLGILPGALRRPLSAPHPLRAPSDFAALRVGYQGASEPADALRALGARPVRLIAGAPWRGIDALEQQLAQINANSYDQAAKYLTANVVFWPRPQVLLINRRTLATLSGAQRQALTGAAHAAVAKTIAAVRSQDRSALAELCRRGIKLVSASATDIEKLRTASAPLLARLERQPQTKSWLAAIGELRTRVAPSGEPPLRCANVGRPSAGGLPDGDYTATITREDAVRELARIPRAERAAAGLAPAGVSDIVHSRFKLSLRHGTFALYQRHADGTLEVGIQGAYSLYRDRFVGRGSNGDTLRARWSFDGAKLRFSDFSFRGAYRLVWASEPWVLAR
jgi:TRAP-type C4-dicarboxylate transport system substrate-binding protein